MPRTTTNPQVQTLLRWLSQLGNPGPLHNATTLRTKTGPRIARAHAFTLTLEEPRPEKVRRCDLTSVPLSPGFFISAPRAPDRCDLPSRSEPIVPAEIETQSPLWVSPEAASSLGRRRSSSTFAQSMATRLWSPRCPMYTLSGPNRLRCSLCNRSQRCPLAMQRSFATAEIRRFESSNVDGNYSESKTRRDGATAIYTKANEF